jgi:hypothetical protein
MVGPEISHGIWVVKSPHAPAVYGVARLAGVPQELMEALWEAIEDLKSPGHFPAGD